MMLPRSPLSGRASTLALAALATLLLAAPAAAQDPPGSDRESAEQALEQTERLLDGRGVRTKRELSAALAELATQTDELSSGDRRAARTILKRPTDVGDDDEYTAPTGDRRSSCSTNFCFHWVVSTGDMPKLTDANGNSRPDYIDLLEASFESSHQVEVGLLGWLPPLPDGGRGINNSIDVYVANIGNFAYGYAAPEGAANSRSNPAYLVLDNDYSAAEFPRYGGNPTLPVQATAAHEYNHALQYRYDSFQDLWMFESTATWAEDKVFDAVNDYRFYLEPWAGLPDQPLTYAGDGENIPPEGNDDDLKMYGSAIWNHWLDGRYGAQVVRQAWAVSVANSKDGGGFAPAAYDRAIRDSCGPGFAYEFEEFTTAVAEWDASNSGIREGASFPFEVADLGALTPNVPATGTLDHTAFALFDVTSAASRLYLTGGLPAGTEGSIALVGYAGGTMTRSLGILDANGKVTVALDDPGRFDRITAVVTNADTSASGFVGNDWLWSKDTQPFTLTASDGTVPPEPAAGPPPAFTPCTPVAPDPDPGPTATPAATPTPPPTTATPTPPPVATTTSVRLARSSTRLRTVARTGLLAFFATLNKAGRLTATATVDKATARRLKLGRRAVRIGTGRRTASRAGRITVNVRLSKKVGAALKRQKRTLRIKVRTRFVPNGGGEAVTRNISLRLKP